MSAKIPAVMLYWENSTPLVGPVVPDVYPMAAGTFLVSSGEVISNGVSDISAKSDSDTNPVILATVIIVWKQNND